MNELRFCLALFVFLASANIAFSESELNLLPPTGSYNVLMLLPYGSPSHRNCFLSLTEGLANRGHQIVILSSHPPRSKHPNIKEINHGVNSDRLHGNKSFFQIREEDPTGGFLAFKVMLPKLMSELYKKTEVIDLYKKRHEFELFIIDDLFNEMAYPFVEGKKFIFIGTSGITPTTSAVLGNVLHPSYTSFNKGFPRPFSFVHRIQSLFWHLFLPVYWRYLAVVPEIQKIASELFPNLPPLLEIERDGLVLALVNTHFTYDASIPRLPSQIEVGGMHCNPGKKLPQAAHQNVKLFITHGGMLSMQEAVFHSTPLLALPVFGDQPKNADQIKKKGFGTYLLWEEITVEKVLEAVHEVITNPKYQKTISEASIRFRDLPAKPLETAIWWTEYVIRNEGAPQLRSPAADLSWIEYLMLDVILLLLSIGFLVFG